MESIRLRSAPAVLGRLNPYLRCTRGTASIFWGSAGWDENRVLRLFLEQGGAEAKWLHATLPPCKRESANTLSGFRPRPQRGVGLMLGPRDLRCLRPRSSSSPICFSSFCLRDDPVIHRCPMASKFTDRPANHAGGQIQGLTSGDGCAPLPRSARLAPNVSRACHDGGGSSRDA